VLTDYIDLAPLPAFLVAAVIICLAPGPDMLYVVGTGLAAGRSAATRAALGITLGVSVYVVLTAVGLGAAVVGFPALLTALQVLGAGYLAWLARRTWQESRDTRPTPVDADPDRHWFRRGFLVNLTNPKVMLFFVAFLPQFLGAAPHPTAQLLLLGLLLQVVGLAVDLGVGWAAGSVRTRVIGRPRVRRALGGVSASVFAGLAALVALEVVRSVG
jgi:threonine/homoserine/homoserine lactone efflux protein